MANELDEVKVSVIGKQKPSTATLETTVTKAAEKMLREKEHSVVIVDKSGKPVGIVSSWDILKITFLADSAREMPVSKLIEGQKLLFVYTEVSVRDALNLMIDKNISALPILDESDSLVGKISLTDIAHFVKEKL
jgi:CBS domain-containing protein